MGIGEILVILVIALLVFGPDRLPTMIKEAAAFIRDLRTMVARARSDLGTSVSDLGIDQEDLDLLRQLRDPKSYLRQQVLDGVDLGLDDPELADSLSLDSTKKSNGDGAAANGHGPKTNGQGSAGNRPSVSTSGDEAATPPPFDPDAT